MRGGHSDAGSVNGAHRACQQSQVERCYSGAGHRHHRGGGVDGGPGGQGDQAGGEGGLGEVHSRRVPLHGPVLRDGPRRQPAGGGDLRVCGAVPRRADHPPDLQPPRHLEHGRGGDRDGGPPDGGAGAQQEVPHGRTSEVQKIFVDCENIYYFYYFSCDQLKGRYNSTSPWTTSPRTW